MYKIIGCSYSSDERCLRLDNYEVRYTELRFTWDHHMYTWHIEFLLNHDHTTVGIWSIHINRSISLFNLNIDKVITIYIDRDQCYFKDITRPQWFT